MIRELFFTIPCYRLDCFYYEIFTSDYYYMFTPALFSPYFPFPLFIFFRLISTAIYLLCFSNVF